MFELWKADAGPTGTTFTRKGEAQTIAGALALAPSLGWGNYKVYSPDGRRVASVRIAPAVPHQDEPVEEPLIRQEGNQSAFSDRVYR